MAKLVLLSFTLFLLTLFISLPQIVQATSLVGNFMGANEIIIESQDYIDSYFDWQFTEINNTNWLANFSINQQLWNDIIICRNLPLIQRPACWNNLKNTYFPDFNAVELGINLLNLTNYPTENLTKNIRFKNFQFDLVYGIGSFNIIFDNGFKINERARFGFGSTIINTTSDTIPFHSSGRAMCRTNNTLHVAYIDGINVYYSNSSDNGDTWRPRKTLSTAASVPATPAIACNGNKTVIFFATGINLRYINSSDEGSTWSTVDIFDNSDFQDNHNSISAVFGVGDNLWVSAITEVGSGTNGTLMLFNTSIYGGNNPTLTSKNLTASDLDGATTILVNVSGNSEEIYIFWTNSSDDDLYLNYSTNSGGSFTGTKVYTGSISWSTSRAGLSAYIFNGTIYVAVEEATGTDAIYLINSTDGGATWGTSTLISDSTIESNNPSLTANSTHLFIFYDAGTANNNDIEYKTWSINGLSSSTILQNLNNPIDSMPVARSENSYNNMVELVYVYQVSSGNIDINFINVSISSTNPQIGIGTYTPVSPATYSKDATYQFNSTINDDNGVGDISTVFFEENFSGSFRNNTVSTFNVINATGRNYTINLTDISGGGYQIKWYANDSVNTWVASLSNNYTINKGNTSMRLWLNGTEGDKYYKNNTKANLTAQVNVSGLTVNLKTNLTQEVNPSSATTPLENISTLQNTTSYIFNITGYFSENENYTASSQTYYVFLDVLAPKVYSFHFNDSYITFNESVKLSVNASDDGGVFNISMVIVEIDTSHSTKNFTLSKESTNNYTYNFTKSDLGEFSANATRINISRIYVNDSIDNVQSNTSSLNFNYTTTSLTDISDIPDPVTNGTGQTFTVTAKWQTTENTNITAGCVVDFLDTNYTMTYSTNTGKYSVGISAAQPVAIYTYSVICTNSSYQSQANPDGSITITVGGSGGGPSGGSSGGSGTTLPSIVTNETIQMFPSQLSGLASAGDSFIIKGIGADYSFRVKNIGKDDLFIIVDFFGDASQWVDLESVKTGGDVKQFTNYASTKEAIQIKPDMVASFNIRMNIPTTTKDETYSFLTTFTDSRTGVFVSAESFVKVSKITSIIKYFTNFISWSYQKLTWKFGISKTGETIDNGFAFKGNVAFMVPFAGAMISIVVFYVTFMSLTSGFIVPYAKKRIAGVNFNIGLAILLSIGITMLVLGFLP